MSQNRFLSAAVIILLSIVLVVMMFWIRSDNRKNREYLKNLAAEETQQAVADAAEQTTLVENLSRLTEEIKSYETEKQSITDELAEKEAALAELTNDQSDDQTVTAAPTDTVAVAYYASKVSDFDLIEEQASAYGFSPVLVADSSTSSEVTDKAQELGYEIVLTEYPFDADKAAKTYGTLPSVAFLLRDGDDKEANLKKLADIGYTSVFRYVDRDISKSPDGLTSIGYYMVSSDKVSSGKTAEEALKAVAKDDANLLLVFNMQKLSAGTLSKKTITAQLDTLQSMTEDSQLSYGTASQLVTSVSEEAQANAEAIETQQKELDEYKAEAEKRIAELDEAIQKLEEEKAALKAE